MVCPVQGSTWHLWLRIAWSPLRMYLVSFLSSKLYSKPQLESWDWCWRLDALPDLLLTVLSAMLQPILCSLTTLTLDVSKEHRRILMGVCCVFMPVESSTDALRSILVPAQADGIGEEWMD